MAAAGMMAGSERRGRLHGASTSGDASDDIEAERQSSPSPPQVVQVRGELGKIEQALRGSMSRMVQSRGQKP
jgi:hypothetical protein